MKRCWGRDGEDRPDARRHSRNVPSSEHAATRGNPSALKRRRGHPNGASAWLIISPDDHTLGAPALGPCYALPPSPIVQVNGQSACPEAQEQGSPAARRKNQRASDAVTSNVASCSPGQRGRSAAGDQDAAAAFEHRQELDLEGLPCLVKMYDAKEGQLKLNDTAEFVGILAYDPLPPPEDSSADANGGIPDPFRGLESFARKLPPPSLVPRLHCICEDSILRATLAALASRGEPRRPRYQQFPGHGAGTILRCRTWRWENPIARRHDSFEYCCLASRITPFCTGRFSLRRSHPFLDCGTRVGLGALWEALLHVRPSPRPGPPTSNSWFLVIL